MALPGKTSVYVLLPGIFVAFIKLNCSLCCFFSDLLLPVFYITNQLQYRVFHSFLTPYYQLLFFFQKFVRVTIFFLHFVESLRQRLRK